MKFIYFGWTEQIGRLVMEQMDTVSAILNVWIYFCNIQNTYNEIASMYCHLEVGLVGQSMKTYEYYL